MRVKLEDNVFFGEEMTKIGSFEKTICGEKILTEVFRRDDGGFAIKKSLIERGNPEPSYDTLDKDSAEMISWYLKAFEPKKTRKKKKWSNKLILQRRNKK